MIVSGARVQIPRPKFYFEYLIFGRGKFGDLYCFETFKDLFKVVPEYRISHWRHLDGPGAKSPPVFCLSQLSPPLVVHSISISVFHFNFGPIESLITQLQQQRIIATGDCDFFRSVFFSFETKFIVSKNKQKHFLREKSKRLWKERVLIKQRDQKQASKMFWDSIIKLEPILAAHPLLFSSSLFFSKSVGVILIGFFCNDWLQFESRYLFLNVSITLHLVWLWRQRICGQQ